MGQDSQGNGVKVKGQRHYFFEGKVELISDVGKPNTWNNDKSAYDEILPIFTNEGVNLRMVVGGETESWCTKCRKVLNHVIVTLVDGAAKRVQCRTCDGEHNWRREPASRRASSTRKKSKALDPDRPAKPYQLSAKFVEDDVVQHPKFGRGHVQLVRGDKIEVNFEDGLRTLLHGHRA